MNTIATTRAVELVDAVQGVIRGYVHIWGDPEHRDSYDTWFDAEKPPELALDFLPVPLHYEHAQDGAIKKEIVGKIYRVDFDTIGARFEASLYKDKPFFGRIVAEIADGRLKTSSATAPHTMDFDDDGRFVRWELHEVSLTENPSESRMPAVEILRSAERGRDATGAEDEPINDPLSTRQQESNIMAEPQANPAPAPETPQRADLNEVIQQLLGEYSMDEIMAALEQLQAPVDNGGEMAAMMSVDGGRSVDFGKQLLAALKQNKADNELAALRAENKRMKDAIAAPPVDNGQRAAHPSNNGGGNVTVSEPRRYWSRSDTDLMFVHQVMKARGQRPTDEFVQVIAGRAAAALEKKDALYANPAVRSALKGVRSDEIMTSTNTGNGDEWVAIAYAGSLWEKARNNRIYQELVSKGMRVEEVPDGHESTVIFTEGSDPTVYTITQSADLDATGRPTVVVPVTAPGTGQVTLTPGYLGMAVAYTSVFEEDSLIAASSQLNNQMNEKAEETIEQLFINGDTASSDNVNYDGDTAPSTAYYQASNGARKYAIVTGSGTSRSGGALDEDDFRLTLKLFPSAIRTRKGQIAFIIDPDTHNTALGIAAIKTEDVRRTNATIVSGLLENIYGVDVAESGFLPLTDTDGKVTYNAAGTVGTILGVYAPFWAMGWKRRVTFETSKDILAQTNLIVATFRLGFLARGAGAAVASYNLTIS